MRSLAHVRRCYLLPAWGWSAQPALGLWQSAKGRQHGWLANAVLVLDGRTRTRNRCYLVQDHGPRVSGERSASWTAGSQKAVSIPCIWDTRLTGFLKDAYCLLPCGIFPNQKTDAGGWYPGGIRVPRM